MSTLSTPRATRRETALHLLYTRAGHADIHTLSTDRTTSHGENVREVAHAAGLPGHLLRRLHFRSLGEADGVRRAECVWHLHTDDDAALDWRPDTAWNDAQRVWITSARTPPSNVPWMQPGWHEGARAWLDAELAAQGRARSGEPVALKHAQISALWRVPTDAGPLYFKAVPDFFAREVEVTPILARELDGAAPPVLAADTARGFLLLGDAGEVVEGALDLNAVMVHVARLQHASLPLLASLTLRDRGPEYVRGWLDHLLTDACLLTGQEGGFTPEEAATLREVRPALEAALLRLAASSIPRTLGHGDLHGGNMVTQGGHVTLLDWSDVCVTHPFMDANPAYFCNWEVELPQPELDAARDLYLRQWTASATPDDLQTLFADALACGELYRALGYVDGLQGAVEDKTEWHGAHLAHLRRVLTLAASLE